MGVLTDDDDGGVQVIVIERAPMQLAEHIGDGVYAMHDGYQVWLAVNDHRNPPVVALEPGVLRNLLAYAKRVGVLRGEP